MNQLVSVVIPTYNCARYINSAIDSVLNQTYNPVEIIVLDDGSTDQTEHILLEYGNTIIWGRHPNMGQSATLNKGWQMARGTILSYLSSDDILLPRAIEEAVKCLEQDDNIVLTYSDYHLIDPEGRILRRVAAPEYSYYDLAVKLECQPGPGVFFRRSAFQQVGGWDTRLRQMPDLDYWLRLGLFGDFKRIPEVYALYRVHNESQTFASIPDDSRALEPVNIVRKYFENEEIIPDFVARNRRKSFANAYLLSARLFIRSYRYKHGVTMLYRSLLKAPENLFSFTLYRILFNALFSRPIYRLIVKARSRRHVKMEK